MSDDEFQRQAAAQDSADFGSNIANKAQKTNKTILILIISFLVTAIMSAAFTVPKVIENNDQNKKLEEIQNQIYEKTKQLETR